MATDRRHKNTGWQLPPLANNTATDATVTNAVLMDIRDELQTLNRLLACPNFTAIPTVLRTIRRNTSGLRKPVAKKAKR